MSSETFINPLEIPKILQQILDFLPISDLKLPRLVNQEWNHEICTLLKKKARIQFNFVEDLPRFTRLFCNSMEFPYKSIIFGSELLYKLAQTYRKPYFQYFCEQFGPYITHLHCNNQYVCRLMRVMIIEKFPNLESLSLLIKSGPYKDIFEDDDDDQDEIKAENITLPNLKHFYINITGYDSKTDGHDLQQFITSILRKCINLETISCKIPAQTAFLKSNYEYQNDQEGFLHPCQQLSKAILDSILDISNSNENDNKDNTLKRLSHLEVLLSVNDQELQSLGNGNFQLQKFYLELDPKITTATLSYFMSNYKYSLETIHLEFTTESLISLELACQMLSLKRISLFKYNGSLSFLMHCPLVYDVNIENVTDWSNCNIYKNGNGKGRRMFPVSDSLKSFRLSYKNAVIGDTAVSKTISIWFPNITSLDVHKTNNNVLRAVFEHLKSLKIVVLKGEDITDAGICGDTDNILKILMESKTQLDEGFNETSMSQMLGFQPRFPCIGDLKDLQFCTIEANLLTDASIIFGVLRCKRLKKLQMHSRCELITSIGVSVSHLSELPDLTQLRIYVRNVGWVTHLHRRLRTNIF